MSEEHQVSRGTAFVLVLCFLAFAAFGAYKCFDNIRINSRMGKEGKTAQAHATGRSYTETRRRFGIKTLSTDLAFTTAEGKVVRLTGAEISREELAQLQEGKTIPREYLADDPENTARIPGSKESIWWTLIMVVVGLVGALGYSGDLKKRPEKKRPDIAIGEHIGAPKSSDEPPPPPAA